MEYLINDKNKYITESVIKDIIKKYIIDENFSFKINNINLYQTAMTHPYYIYDSINSDRIIKLTKEMKISEISNIDMKNCVPLQKESYERMEFLGDAIIHSILADYLYIRYNDKNEGFLTKMRIKIENGKVLSNLCRKIGLVDYVLLPRFMELNDERKNSISIFEDVFEAFIGALFVDTNSNYTICRKFIIAIIESEIDFVNLIISENNYKDILLKYHHKKNYSDPIYFNASIEDTKSEKSSSSKTSDEKNKKFKMGIYYFDKDGIKKIIAYGYGVSKKKGEQNAAKNALKYYKVATEIRVNKTLSI